MEIDVRDQEKRAYLWLTRAESEDASLKEALKPLYRAFKAKHYLVAVFESGTERMEDLTRDLLLYNRFRLRELETSGGLKKEKRY